jgi:hypothetical protein
MPMPAIVDKAIAFVKANTVPVLMIAVLFWVIGFAIGKSTFENNPNAIRRYIVSTDGVSLDDKMHYSQRSGLTGSRDAPVFFSDYDIEMKKDSEGNLVADREQFVDEKVTDVTNIESRFMLN